MKNRISYQNRTSRTAHIIDNGFEKTVPGLSLSPSQVSKMAEKGISVSTQIANSFVDGSPNPTFDVPIEELRGVDVNDVWNASQDAKKRIISAHLKDKEIYG